MNRSEKRDRSEYTEIKGINGGSYKPVKQASKQRINGSSDKPVEQASKLSKTALLHKSM